MDKLEIPGGALPAFNPIAYTTPRDRAARKPLKKTPFSRLLEVQDAALGAEASAEAAALPAYAPSQELLQELLDDVHSAGDALKTRPLAEEIRQYKKAVRHFLHYVVENGFAVKTESYLFNHEKRRKVQIAVVDQKLEELAAGILSGQLAQVALLARLDEISGLLVDLMQ